jgi:hypothetical protein
MNSLSVKRTNLSYGSAWHTTNPRKLAKNEKPAPRPIKKGATLSIRRRGGKDGEETRITR